MKNLTFSIAATLTLILGLSISLSAQTTATWQGGKPGRTTDWNCAANWSEGKTPDEFTQVIIPYNVQYYPVIKDTVAPIDALLMEGGTSLTIQVGANLAVLGETGRFGGITVFGKIENNGTLEIGEAVHTSIAFRQRVQGNGIITCQVGGADMLAKRR